MKRGTNVGLDKNFNNVCVGDNIIDKDGSEYVINAYGLAVDLRKGGTKKLSEVKDFEVVKKGGAEQDKRGGRLPMSQRMIQPPGNKPSSPSRRPQASRALSRFPTRSWPMNSAGAVTPSPQQRQ